MRAHRIASIAALVVAPLVLSGATCVKFPTLVDRVVQLVQTQTQTVGFTGVGNSTTYSDTKVVDLGGYVSLSDLSANGIDPKDIVSVKLVNVSYMVTRANTVAAGNPRSITSGTVEITPAGGATSTLGSLGSQSVSSIMPYWGSPTLNATGMNALNSILAAVLAELQAPGGVVGTHNVSIHSFGTADGATDFDYDVKLDVQVVWKQSTKMIN